MIRKVYLMNEMLDITKAKKIIEKEIITILNNDKILLCISKENDDFNIYRKEKINFLESKTEGIKISEQEFNIMKELVDNKNLDDIFIKHSYELNDNVFFNIYDGKYQGLVTLEKFSFEENEFKNINGIDITDCDIASDLKLLNMNFDEVQSEIAQLRITGTNLY